MYGKGIDDCLKAIALYEKVLDDSAKGFGNTQGIPLDILDRIGCCVKNWRTYTSQ
ncbi:hypothetical protein ACP70R_018207 [Stipagrostis hirtigluma subsp. patula]